MCSTVIWGHCGDALGSATSLYRALENTKRLGSRTVKPDILIKPLHDLLLAGFDNEHVYTLHVVSIMFSCR